MTFAALQLEYTRLQATVRAQEERLSLRERELAVRNNELAVRDSELVEARRALAEEALRRREAEAKVKDLLRRLFGPTSEKIDPAQHLLALESVEADGRIAEAPAPQPATVTPVRPKRGPRRPLPEHLPIEVVVHDLPEAAKRCPQTGVALVKIRDEVTEEIEYRRSQFYRLRHVVPVYASPTKSCPPVQAKLVRVIPQSQVGTALLSHLIVGKYTDHLPLYRQEQIAARHGVTLERRAMSLWVERVAELLLFVHAQLQTLLFGANYIQADETPVRVLDPARPGAARLAWLWAFNGPTVDVILFEFRLSRGHQALQETIPPDWRGHLQSDAYAAYAHFVAEREGIVGCGCLAHARRKWTEAVDGGGETVAAVLALFAKLYQIEADIRGRVPAEREAARGIRSLPLLRQLHDRLVAARTEALPASGIGRAAEYALANWEQLTRYAQPGCGQIEIDNNPIENGIRPTALGKKNWLFVGHPDAGWKSAVIYSILGTCKLLHVDPEDYLNWVLPKLAGGTTHNLKAILPHDYKRFKEQAQSAPAPA